MERQKDIFHSLFHSLNDHRVQDPKIWVNFSCLPEAVAGSNTGQDQGGMAVDGSNIGTRVAGMEINSPILDADSASESLSHYKAILVLSYIYKTFSRTFNIRQYAKIDEKEIFQKLQFQSDQVCNLETDIFKKHKI